ncbi:MAG: hypothetical protein H6657_32565 [Ardenticatenaceae bacterium]|nr:hypothetical protein [Ardenticatenaceae bacterium]
MSQLELYLLGTPIVKLNGVEIHFPLKRSLVLLIFCALNPERHDRAHLEDLLWEEMNTQSRGLNNAFSRLKQTLVNREKTFPFDDFFLSTHDGLEFKVSRDDFSKFYCDTFELEYYTLDSVLLQTGIPELERVASLYRGEFMGAYAVRKMNPEFDNWVMAMQVRFEILYHKLLNFLTKVHIRQGNFEKAIGYLYLLFRYDHLLTEANIGLLLICFVLNNQRYQIEIAQKQYEEAISQLSPKSRSTIKKLIDYLLESVPIQVNQINFIRDLYQELSLHDSELGQMLQTIVREESNDTSQTTIDTTSEIIKLAREEAQMTGCKLVGRGHLFLALVAKDKATVAMAKHQLQVDLHRVASGVRYVLQVEELDSQNVEVEDITLALANMLTRASESSKKNGGATNEYTLWHALLTEENCLLGQIFDRYQISRTHLLNLFTGRNNVN